MAAATRAEQVRRFERLERLAQRRFLLLLAPAIVFLAVFYAYPVAAMLLRAFNDPTGASELRAADGGTQPVRDSRRQPADERLSARDRHHHPDRGRNDDHDLAARLSGRLRAGVDGAGRAPIC